MKGQKLFVTMVLILGWVLPACPASLLGTTTLPNAVRIGSSGLISLQNPDGSWGDNQTPGAIPVYRDTSVVLQSLQTLGRENEPAFSQGANFLENHETTDNDVLSRKLAGLSGALDDLNSLQQDLLQAKIDTAARLDGKLYNAQAWPFDDETFGNILDTALSYRALLMTGTTLSENDHILTQVYIGGNQLSDGGWSFRGNTTGDVYITSLVLLALTETSQVLPSVYNPAVTGGRQFLVDQQNGNGSWGALPGQVAETALAGLALQRLSTALGDDATRQEIEDAAEWLRDHQLIDGTWPRGPQDPPDLLQEGDAYESAVALSFLQSQVALSPTPTPVGSEPTATPTSPAPTPTPTMTTAPKPFSDLNSDSVVDYQDMFLFSFSLGQQAKGRIQYLGLGEKVSAYHALEIIHDWHQPLAE